MTIENVSIIGLGALGIMYAHHISQKIPFERLSIIADQQRIDRYRKDGIFCNGDACNFNYVTPNTPSLPADLLIFTVKYNHLAEAIQSVRHHIGKHTIILSALNGVISEQEIGKVYGHHHNLYCVAQGMDALKEGNRMVYKNMGLLCFGELKAAENSDKVTAVANFFNQISLPFEINNHMSVKLWSKLMINTGINQTVALLGGTTAIVQQDGEARSMMIAAMKEVLLIANKENIPLSDEDIDYWLEIVDHLNPVGMPSMGQDLKAQRLSEVELFSGTIITLAKKYGLEVPVNQMLYDKITAIEAAYQS